MKNQTSSSKPSKTVVVMYFATAALALIAAGLSAWLPKATAPWIPLGLAGVFIVLGVDGWRRTRLPKE
jgi:hypothetical protein